MDDRLEALFNEYSGMVFRLCLRYVASREEAEDLTQEVFLKVDRHLNEFQGASSIGTWIYRIAANLSLDYLRKLNRRTDLYARQLTDIVERNFHSGGDKELAAIDLERLLSHVKPEVREFLFLTQMEGLSHQEAAKITGKSPEAISKAVQKFKKSEPVKIRALESQRIDQKASGRSD